MTAPDDDRQPREEHVVCASGVHSEAEPQLPPELGGLLEQRRSAFPHPPWTVGVVLILGAVMLLLGVAGNPIWLLIGAPFVLTLLVWISVRLIVWFRPRSGPS